jgi:hypothetical protein
MASSLESQIRIDHSFLVDMRRAIAKNDPSTSIVAAWNRKMRRTSLRRVLPVLLAGLALFLPLHRLGVMARSLRIDAPQKRLSTRPPIRLRSTSLLLPRFEKIKISSVDLETTATLVTLAPSNDGLPGESADDLFALVAIYPAASLYRLRC